MGGIVRIAPRVASLPLKRRGRWLLPCGSVNIGLCKCYPRQTAGGLVGSTPQLLPVYSDLFHAVKREKHKTSLGLRASQS